MSERFVIRREMAVSRADFLRLLALALGDESYSLAENTVTVADGKRRLTLRLSPEAQRKLGSLRFPVISIEMEFQGYSEGESERWLARLDRYFQRAGG